MSPPPVVTVRAAVVIPCRDEAAHIGQLLDALAAQTTRPADVVIVDDQSTDATADVIQLWQSTHPGLAVRAVTGRGLGPGPAMNDGIRATSVDIIIRFDAHALPDPDYVGRSLDAVSDTRVGVAGGVWRVQAGLPTAIGRAIALVVSHPLGSGGALYRHADAAGPERVLVETVPFGAFRRTLWERLGGFDESLAVNQDFDFNYRVRRAGFDVVLDRRIRATYFARPTLAALARQYFRYGFWKCRMLRKDPRSVHWRQIPPTLVLPWVLATTVSAVATPGLLTGLLAALYPALLLAGAAQIASRGAHVFAAFTALGTVHLCWSAGFWMGVGGTVSPTRKKC